MTTSRIRILTYNIHKGFSSVSFKYVLKGIQASIRETNADILLLQEVVGHHERHPISSQFEFLADQVWPHFAYGKNAIYTKGHHGNAILSKFPISFWENQDVSRSRIERRGLLHAAIEIPGHTLPLHLVCAHLGLFEVDRKLQLKNLCERLSAMVPRHSPLIIGGDFNDWREQAGSRLKSALGLHEAFLELQGESARSFPSWLPVLKLDRLYFRGLDCLSAEIPKGALWRELSDHLPLIAEFSL
jgi:endonuclease/exonuclease/phosphatase family metal-dependent hydrolase